MVRPSRSSRRGLCSGPPDRPWQRGAARLALTTGAPLVPVAIVGADDALRPGTRLPRRARVKVLIRPPVVVETASPTIPATRELTWASPRDGRSSASLVAGRRARKTVRHTHLVPGRRFDAFATGEAPERPADPAVRKANLRRIIRLFWPYRARLALVCGLIVVAAGLGVISPFLLRELPHGHAPAR